MGSVNILGLHGFLGDPEDFRPMVDGIVPRYGRIKFYFPNLYQQELGPHIELAHWGRHLNHWIEQRDDGNPWIMIGYSMGGRLLASALEVLESRKAQFVFISSFMGKSREPNRILDDQEWAKMFLNEDWPVALKKWNQHPTLVSSQENQNSHLENYKHELAMCLTNWSQGIQKDQHQILARNADRVRYYFGSKDTKYLQYGHVLSDLGIRTIEVPQSGHRILRDNSQFICSEVLSLMS